MEEHEPLKCPEEYDHFRCSKCGSKYYLHTEQKGRKAGKLVCVNPDCKDEIHIPADHSNRNKLLKRIALATIAIALIAWFGYGYFQPDKPLTAEDICRQMCKTGYRELGELAIDVDPDCVDACMREEYQQYQQDQWDRYWDDYNRYKRY